MAVRDAESPGVRPGVPRSASPAGAAGRGGSRGRDPRLKAAKAEQLKALYYFVEPGESREALKRKILPNLPEIVAKAHHPADDKVAEWMRAERGRADERAERRWRRKFEDWQQAVLVHGALATTRRLASSSSDPGLQRSPSTPLPGLRIKSPSGGGGGGPAGGPAGSPSSCPGSAPVAAAADSSKDKAALAKVMADLRRERKLRSDIESSLADMRLDRDAWRARAEQAEAALAEQHHSTAPSSSEPARTRAPTSAASAKKGSPQASKAAATAAAPATVRPAAVRHAPTPAANATLHGAVASPPVISPFTTSLEANSPKASFSQASSPKPILAQMTSAQVTSAQEASPGITPPHGNSPKATPCPPTLPEALSPHTSQPSSPQAVSPLAGSTHYSPVAASDCSPNVAKGDVLPEEAEQVCAVSPHTTPPLTALHEATSQEVPTVARLHSSSPQAASSPAAPHLTTAPEEPTSPLAPAAAQAAPSTEEEEYNADVDFDGYDDFPATSQPAVGKPKVPDPGEGEDEHEQHEADPGAEEPAPDYGADDFEDEEEASPATQGVSRHANDDDAYDEAEWEDEDGGPSPASAATSRLGRSSVKSGAGARASDAYEESWERDDGEEGGSPSPAMSRLRMQAVGEEGEPGTASSSGSGQRAEEEDDGGDERGINGLARGALANALYSMEADDD